MKILKRKDNFTKQLPFVYQKLLKVNWISFANARSGQASIWEQR